jgi:hypothetical protein
MDCNEWHYEKPEDTNMRLIAIKGVGRTLTTRRGFYEERWNKWYLAGGNTLVHPKKWAYLIKP